MPRSLFTSVLAVAMVLLLNGPAAYSQYGPQYPQTYPSNPSYGGAQYGQPAPRQDAPVPGQDMAADEEHGVARLSVVQGDVNVKRGDTGELVAAVTNAPVMMQDHLQTSPGSRAEVELDYGNVVRLAPNTDIGFADLEYGRFQVQLAAGAIVYRVLRDSNAQTEVDTPSIALRPEGQGEYRITVLDDGSTQISVRSGQAEIFSPRGSERLSAGHTILVRGNPADPELQPVYDAPRDQLDDWSATRDRELLSSQSYRYVSRDISGADDLDGNGNWVPSQYGQVWQPTVTGPDWSPYSDGQWSWQPYYGWTWVDAAPWGWAPYHYGRWFWNGGHRWCWWPGAVGPRSLWSPALVGFFGWGGGTGFGFGGLGWVALAPYESFHPWWGHSWGRGGYRYGDFSGVRAANMAGIYRNAAIRGGALAAGYNAFGGFHQRFSPATTGQLSGVGVFRGQMPVQPTRNSYQFSGRQVNSNPRLASAANRQFFYHQAPRMGAPGQAASGWTRVGNGTASYGRNNAYSAPSGAPAGGWQHFGDPGRANGTSQGFVGIQEPSGWHRFGEARQAMPAYSGRPSYASPAYGRGNYNGNAAPPPRQNFSGSGGPSGGGRSSYSAPRQSAPSAPHNNAPAPSFHGGGGGAGRGGGDHSSGGHHGR